MHLNSTARLLLENLPMETEDATGGVTSYTLADTVNLKRGTTGSTLVYLLDQGYVKREKNPELLKSYLWWKKKEVRKPAAPRKKFNKLPGDPRNVEEIQQTETPEEAVLDLERVLEQFLIKYKKNKETLQLIAECLRDAEF